MQTASSFKISNDYLRIKIIAIVIICTICTLQTATCHADFLDDVFGGDDTVGVKTYRTHNVRHNHHHESNKSFGLHYNSSSHNNFSHIRAQRTAENTHKYADETLSNDVPGTAKSDQYKHHLKLSMCYPNNISEQQINQLNPIFHDKTLKKGDSIVTNIGVQVFRGPNDCPHKTEDFVALKSSKFSNKMLKTTLIEIDKAANARARQFDQESLIHSKSVEKTASK